MEGELDEEGGKKKRPKYGLNQNEDRLAKIRAQGRERQRRKRERDRAQKGQQDVRLFLSFFFAFSFFLGGKLIV